MPLRCPCGNNNPEESNYCNKCGRDLSRPEGPKTCPRCLHTNPQHVVYCGHCGADLDVGHATAIPSEKFLPSQSPDAYVRWEEPGGGQWLTKSRFWTLTAVLIFWVIADVWQIMVIEGHWLGGSILLLFLVALWYIVWRSGREGAGWRG